MQMKVAEIAALINSPGGMGGNLSIETVEKMVKSGRIQSFGEGEFVTRRGQERPQLCFVLSGVVRLTAFTEDGREMLTHIIHSGECWGVHPCLGQFNEANDTIFEKPGGSALMLKPDMVDQMMQTHYDFQKAMIAVLCKRLNMAALIAEQFGAWTATERLAWRLLLIARGLPSQDMESYNPLVTISQETLASMLHLSRQRTNFLLKAMEAKGLVKLSYGKIELMDRAGLIKLTARAR